MFHKKQKLPKTSRIKPGTNPLQSVGSDSGNLKQLKYVKTSNNAMGFLLVSCRVIPRPATIKCKITVLQKQPLRSVLKNRRNLKSNNLKFR